MTGFEKKNNDNSSTVEKVHDYVNDLNKLYCLSAVMIFQMSKVILVAFIFFCQPCHL